jgi:hypothetical protein
LRYLSPVRHTLVAALTLGLTAALAAAAPDAHANGRFPESNAIFFAPSEDGYVLLRTTFGQIVSHDRGKSWDWVCERSIGLAGIEDPMYVITPDGTEIASSFQGLAVSHDGACNFGFVGGLLKDLVFVDLAFAPSMPGTVIALASSYGGQNDASVVFYKSTLFETTDEGKTFAALPAAFDSSLLLETVDVTATDPNRIYVSAIRDPGARAPAVLLTSKDRGRTFEETPIPSEGTPLIAAVDPTNADRVYVRTSDTVDKPSHLLVSDDAGKTFRTIFTGTGPLPGFALSDDGKRIYFGGPKDGLRVANTVDYQWEQKSQVEIGCLKLAHDGLWACSTERSGFVVGLSTDEGATFQPKLHFCDIRGPLACPVGSSTHTECSLGGVSPPAPPWPLQRARLGCGDPDGAGLDGGGDSSAEAGPELLDAGGGGCGCSVRTPPKAPIAALLAGASATVALLRRRRSRSEP